LDLTGAKCEEMYLRGANLTRTNLEAAIMPDGSRHE
jgi:uncharacterized protein YjbI with pentapeptide repeats